MYEIGRSRRAITLIEMLITIVLVTILIGAVWMVYNVGLKVFYSQFTRSNIKGEAGRALLNMSRELRQAASITNAQALGLTFTADTDNDGIDETIQYGWSSVSGDPLNRVSIGMTSPLISSLSALAFSYYDADNNLLTFPVAASNVRLVAIDLTAARTEEAIRLSARVDLRNL